MTAMTIIPDTKDWTWVLERPCPECEQDPAEVAAELRQAALAIAGRFESVSGGQWQRTGTRSDGARFTVETFARYFIHDPVHHLYDATGRRAVPA
jgi:hypothetical protein